MNYLFRTTLLGLFFGTFGTTIGGIIGVLFKKSSNRFLSTILSFAAGLMLAIVCFDLTPEAMKFANIPLVLLGMMLGIGSMMICEEIVEKRFQHLSSKVSTNKSSYHQDLLKTGFITSMGLAIHNFPEGLAIGSGFEASIVLGYSLAIAICIHDIPEGISMAVPLKNGGIGKRKVIFYVILSGITTGIGAFVGKLVGDISETVIAMCLSFAAGAMLYIVSGELIPESNKLYSGKLSTIGNIAGFLLGFLTTII